MMNTIANAVLRGAVKKGAGVHPAGPIPATLLTTGATLLLTRGRRPIGLALIAVGGLLLWYEHEETVQAKAGAKPRRPSPRAAT